MAELTPGKDTSERRGTLVAHGGNLLTAIVGLLLYFWADAPEWLVGILIGAASLGSNAVQSSYNDARAKAKAGHAIGNGSSTTG